MSLFVYDGLKSLPAGGAGKGQVYPCANVVGGRMQASELQSQATSRWVWYALWEQKKKRQERYPTIKTITTGTGKHRDEARVGEPLLSAWHLDPAGAGPPGSNKQLLMRGTWGECD